MTRRGRVLVVLALAATAVPAVVAHAAAPAPAGRLFYSLGELLPIGDPPRGGQIYAVNADGSDPSQVTHVTGRRSAGDPDVSPDGTRVLYVSNPRGPFQVWVMNADGTDQHRAVKDAKHDAYVPRWSPDGTHLLFTRCSTPLGFLECTIATAALDGSGLHDITTGHWLDLSSAYAPDGATVAFAADRGGLVSAIFRTTVAGDPPHRLTPADREAGWPDYRPDGHRILFGDNADRPTSNLWTMRPNGSDARQISHVAPDQNLAFARYSPDGRQVVADFFDGRAEWLVTMNADGSGLTKIVRTDALTLADWAVAS